jgi:hypothetical protein
MNSTLTSRILNTLYKDTALSFKAVQQQFKQQDIQDECLPLIQNGMISFKKDSGQLYMTPRQRHNFTFLSDHHEGRIP